MRAPPASSPPARAHPGPGGSASCGWCGSPAARRTRPRSAAERHADAAQVAIERERPPRRSRRQRSRPAPRTCSGAGTSGGCTRTAGPRNGSRRAGRRSAHRPTAGRSSYARAASDRAMPTEGAPASSATPARRRTRPGDQPGGARLSLIRSRRPGTAAASAPRAPKHGCCRPEGRWAGAPARPRPAGGHRRPARVSSAPSVTRGLCTVPENATSRPAGLDDGREEVDRLHQRPRPAASAAAASSKAVAAGRTHPPPGCESRRCRCA